MKKIFSALLAAIMIIVSVPTVNAASEKTFEEYILESLSAAKTEIDVTAYAVANNWDSKTVMAQYQAVIGANPRIFYTDGAVSYKYSYSKSTGKTTSGTLYNIKYSYTKDEVKSMSKKFNTAIDKALATINDKMSDVEIALALHDYLILNTAYDNSLKKFSAYDCLVNGSAVCQGYSLAYKLLMEEAGIRTELVTSESMNHAWNYVYINKKWYHVDVTMDDPLYTDNNGVNQDALGKVMHTNFMLSDAAIKKTSTPHKGWVIPSGTAKATSTAYDKAFWRNSTSGMFKIGDYWYYTEMNASSPAKTGSGKAIETYLKRYSFKTGKSSKLYTINASWLVWGKSNSFYTDSYSKLGVSNGVLYFNSGDVIYSYKPGATTIKTFCKPSTSKGYIYGINVVNGKVYYSIKQSPSAADNISSKKI